MDEMVSVIMSTYNESEQYIKESIESILAQTWNNIEFIIVIDNPENRVVIESIKEYEKNNKNIRVICNDLNRGLPYSLNRALAESKGVYVARMDADDISFKQRIEKEVHFLKKNKLDMVSSNRIDIDEDGRIVRENRKVIKTDQISKVLPRACVINHSSVLLKAEVLKAAGGYREINSVEDYDLWLRLLSENKKIGIIQYPLIYYRIRHDGIGRKDNYLQRIMTEYVQFLFYERILHSYDSYSEQGKALFLKENGYWDISKQKQYIKAMGHFEEGIKKCNQKDLRGMIEIIRSLNNCHIRKQLKDLLVMKWYTR